MVYYYKLWNLLKEKGISQKEIANRTGVSSATLTKIRKGEYVSLEVIDKIGDELGCTIEDLLTSTPPSDDTADRIGLLNDFETISDQTREALVSYMEKRSFSASDIAKETGLSVNTVKGFLNGKPIYAASFMKLCKLGTEFEAIVQQGISDAGIDIAPRKTVYCDGNGNNRKKCWGSHSVWNPDKKCYEHYCAFGFSRTQDSEGKFIAQEDCPHPYNTKEFAAAKEKYELILRDTVIHIPAKKGSDNR